MHLIFVRYLYLYPTLLFFSLLFSEEESSIRGVILDYSNQKPIPGANIYIENSDIGTVSDDLGAFSLQIDNLKINEVKISMIGYRDTTLFINQNNIQNKYQVFLNPKTIQITGVTVHSHKESKGNVAPSSISMVGNKLKKNIISDLATTLTGESGIAVRSSGQATQRPILRGYSGDRFLITSDNFELGDMSNSTADHAVSMEISSAESIELIRGPETLVYGSNTVAGIINILTPVYRQQKLDNPSYKFLMGHESSNQSNLLSANINVPLKSYQIFTNYSKRTARDQSSPIGDLKNTALIKDDFTFAITKFGQKNFSTLQIKNFSMDYGIPGSPEGHIDGVDLKLKNLSQKFLYHSDINILSFKFLELEQCYIRYGHQEFVKDANYASVDLKQNIFCLNASLIGKNLKIGANYQNRDYLTKGFIWTPNSNEMKMSLFGIKSKNVSNLKLQFSGRLEYRSVKPSVNNSFFSNIDASSVKDRHFTLASFGGSALYTWDNFSMYNHLLYTSRAPKIEDLFSDGPHLGSYSYEIGEPTLDAENTFGFENTLSFFNDRNILNLTTYFNYSSNFHIFQKMGEGYEPGADWIEWGSGSSGWLYKYKLNGLESIIYGFEPNTKLNLRYFNFLANASICRGFDLENDIPIAYIPPDLIRIQIEKNIHFLNNTLEVLFVSKQDRLGEFETQTNGYQLLNYKCSYTLSRSENIHQIIFQVTNILNETYYNHLSKIKMIMPEPGIGMNINYSVKF